MHPVMHPAMHPVMPPVTLPDMHPKMDHLTTALAPTFLALLLPAWAGAQDLALAPADQQVEVTGHYDNALGSSDAASQGTIRAALLKSRPAMRPGEVLEFVPGMIVTQHSGDGKANQYFLRGFNLDHGTDFATSVGGMPVNMPTHAHGQGYTDLNFLIPELVQRIEYRKGPYFAKGGDFASAGSADIVYRTRLDETFGQITLGQRGYRRAVAGASGSVAEDVTALAVLEAMGNDGPWTQPEGLQRSNGVVTFSGGTAAQGWQASVMGYRARWASTDQVPQRLIDAGSYQGRPFGRFDAVDPTDGGSTERYSLSGAWHRAWGAGTTKVSAYAMRYRLQLVSNFTYALERPATGDQFKQSDARGIGGLAASHAVDHGLFGWPAHSEAGVQLRLDRIRVGLFDTVARVVTGTTRDDLVRSALAGAYGQTALELRPWLRGIVGLRVDQIRSAVDSRTQAANSGTAGARQLSPKLTLVAGPFAKTEFFFNAGRGLHSNDARGTTIRLDPKTGEVVEPVQPLVSSRGQELGARSEWIPGLQSSLALWQLDFDSELVYAGDAGATEAAAASRRHGVEFNNRYAPLPWLLLDADLAWTHARFVNGDRIPNAVDRVASLSASVRQLGPFSASLQWRYLGTGALTEDNSVRSPASLTANLRLVYSLAKGGSLGRLGQLGMNGEVTLDVFNLFDRKVNDIQYVYASRLPGEVAPVSDRHVHPAEPRAVRLTLRLGF
jgi:hypothetical protein